MSVLQYAIDEGVISLYTTDLKGYPVFLHSISVDCSVETLQSFMLDCVAKAADYDSTPAFTAADVFRSNGSVRGVTLTGTVNDRKWLVQLRGKRILTRKYDPRTAEADVVYIAHRLGRLVGFDDTTLTFQLVCFALRAQTKPVVVTTTTNTFN